MIWSTVEIIRVCKRYMHPHVHCSTITISKTWKQLKCPSTDEWIKKMWYIYTYIYIYIYIYIHTHTHTHRHNGILFIHKNNKILSFATT